MTMNSTQLDKILIVCMCITTCARDRQDRPLYQMPESQTRIPNPLFARAKRAENLQLIQEMGTLFYWDKAKTAQEKCTQLLERLDCPCSRGYSSIN